ncbi:MAG: acyl-CoA dehydrogenase family protein [Actinomycetia bacterium]|nr:acyl-CoA dehydrogenase family protein [Actinomycetes bacterium]
MRIQLTSEQLENRSRFGAFAEEHIAPLAAASDRNGRIEMSVVKRLARERFLGSRVAVSFGGDGLDMISYGLLHEEFGKACSSTRSLLTVHDMVCEAVERLGNENMREQWLPLLTSGERIAAFALTEPASGSDASSIATTAVLEGDEYLITGKKTWISFAQLADVFLLIARDGEHGTMAGFLVPADTDGLVVRPISDILGLRGSMLGEVELTECRVPASSRVGSPKMPAGLIVATALQLGRYSVAWGSVAIAEACVASSFRYSSRRYQFNVPIFEHQLIRAMLTEMLAETKAARLLCYEAGYLAQERKPDAVEATLIAKFFASKAAARISADAVQIHGANGVSKNYAVERHFRDARVMEIIEGSTQIQQITIPKYGLRSYSENR